MYDLFQINTKKFIQFCFSIGKKKLNFDIDFPIFLIWIILCKVGKHE